MVDWTIVHATFISGARISRWEKTGSKVDPKRIFSLKKGENYLLKIEYTISIELSSKEIQWNFQID